MKKFYFILIAFVFMTQMTYADLSILLVNDNNYTPERIEPLESAITDAGYIYTYYEAFTEGGSPSYELMSGFDLVIWYTGNDSSGLFFWNGDETDNEDLIEYLDNGGMLWVQGLDFLYDRYASTPWDYVAGDFVYDYLGIQQYYGQSHIDDGFYADGVPQLDVVSDNGIFSTTPITWTLANDTYLYYVDALVPTNTASGLYNLGPAGYDLDQYAAFVYNEIGDAKIITSSYSSYWAELDQLNSLTAEGLEYFSQFSSGTGIPVESITVSGEDGATTIEENGGSLQMYAEVLPEDATIQAVTWSVTNGTGYAFIDNNGLLTATGTSIGNGTVWVKATSFDGTNISDSLEITISNQVNNPEFEVLLVNDNANGTDRYLVLDTTLLNLGYSYDIHNTVTTSTAPSFAQMSAYDLVIWYTGNDGVNLHLWDVSDTNNYKFNEDLINYINHNGNVWVQGLDFMYDIVGGAPDAFSAGQFIHDYMGISNYAAQSKTDDNDLGVPQLDVVPNNGISEFTPIQWAYETMWYVDGFEISDDAKGMYKMGPNGYVLDDYYSGLYLKKPGRGYVITWAFETARIDTRENTEEIFDEVLSFVKDNSGTGIQEWDNATASIDAIYPNPATDIATINYQLENAAQVSLEVYDITGRIIHSQSFGKQTQGQHRMSIDKNQMNLENGIYLYSIIINNEKYTGKVVFK